jgi:hypothetical protein
VSFHSCNNVLLVATNFFSALSLEVRHGSIIMPQETNCSSMERKHPRSRLNKFKVHYENKTNQLQHSLVLFS